MKEASAYTQQEISEEALEETEELRPLGESFVETLRGFAEVLSKAHDTSTPFSAPEVFLEGMGFYNRMLDPAVDGPRVQEYRVLEDTLLRARWLLKMLSDEEEVGEEDV